MTANEYGVSLQSNENVLELGSGDHCTVMNCALHKKTPLNCTLSKRELYGMGSISQIFTINFFLKKWMSELISFQDSTGVKKATAPSVRKLFPRTTCAYVLWDNI